MRTVEVPWARPGSGFSLQFEALALALIEREMPVNRVAEIMKINPQRNLFTLIGLFARGCQSTYGHAGVEYDF